MKLEYHLKTTGGAGKYIHLFLDQFFKEYREDHRVILHHKKGIELVGKLYGYDAMVIAENHIRDDWEGGLPNGPNDLNYYRYVWAYDLHDFVAAHKFANELFSEEK